MWALVEILPKSSFFSMSVKSFCANYLFNQWLEFDQTSTDTSLWQGKERRFWWPWPDSLHYKDSKSEPCVYSISWINRWNLTKLAQIHNWNWGKKWLDFDDLYLIFKVTPAFWNSDFDRKSLCAHFVLNQLMEFYQSTTGTSLGHWKEVNRFWWPWPHFQGHYIIKTLKMSLVCSLSHESIEGIWSTSTDTPLDGGKKWLDFVDLDLIFIVTLALWNSDFYRKKACVHTISWFIQCHTGTLELQCL